MPSKRNKILSDKVIFSLIKSARTLSTSLANSWLVTFNPDNLDSLIIRSICFCCVSSLIKENITLSDNILFRLLGTILPDIRESLDKYKNRIKG